MRGREVIILVRWTGIGGGGNGKGPAEAKRGGVLGVGWEGEWSEMEKWSKMEKWSEMEKWSGTELRKNEVKKELE